MPSHLRIWTVVMLVVAAVPLSAQEWIYCPAAPEELERQCRQSETTIRQTQELVTTVGDQMHNPDIILAKVERRSDESLALYRARAKQQQGVATPATNRWLPIRGRYFDPSREIIYVALDRQAYWQYIWEALAPDEDLARRTFAARERISAQFKEAQFTNPGAKLAQWQQEIEAAQRFSRQCCQEILLPAPTTAPALPGKAPRP